jgi:hypothetical protein
MAIGDYGAKGGIAHALLIPRLMPHAKFLCHARMAGAFPPAGRLLWSEALNIRSMSAFPASGADAALTLMMTERF